MFTPFKCKPLTTILARRTQESDARGFYCSPDTELSLWKDLNLMRKRSAFTSWCARRGAEPTEINIEQWGQSQNARHVL